MTSLSKAMWSGAHGHSRHTRRMSSANFFFEAAARNSGCPRMSTRPSACRTSAAEATGGPSVCSSCSASKWGLGTAWLAGDGAGQVPSNKIQSLSEWRSDIGIGFDAGGFAIGRGGC